MSTGCSGPYRVPKEQDWRQRHYDALHAPMEQEAPLVTMLEAASAMIDEHSVGMMERGAPERAAMAAILLGVRVMLGCYWGERLDKGTLDQELIRMASSMSFDLDSESFI